MNSPKLNIYGPSMEELPQDVAASPFTAITLDAEYIPLQLSSPTSVLGGGPQVIDLDYQMSFLDLMDFRPEHQEPTEQDLKPKLRYRVPG